MSSSASATASNQSFLERSVVSMPVAKIPIQTTKLSQDPYYICLGPRLEPKDEGVWTGDVIDSTWNSRGWCLQEVILSRRLLHFCRNKIYFECRAIFASEENELRLRLSSAGKRTNDTSALCLFSLAIPRQEQSFKGDAQDDFNEPWSEKTPERRWRSIVEHYSRRQLTYASDKLPALSGLASHYARLTGHKYLAGLWHENLAQSLLWSLDPQLRVRALPPSYRAPSWSWASHDGEILMSHVRSSESTSIRFLETAATPAGSNKFGAVESGYLKVSGLMLKIDFVPNYNHFARFVTFARPHFPYDLEIKRGTDDRRLKVGECHLDRDDVSILRPEVWYLEVFSDELCRPTGLVLQTTNQNDDEFMRIGVATTNSIGGGGLATFSQASALLGAYRRTITIY